VLYEPAADKLVSGNLEATKAEFDTAGADADYHRYDGYAGLTLNRARTDLGLDLGYSRVEYRDNAISESSPLVRGTLDWRISPRSLLTTTLRYQLTDATQNLVATSIENEYGDLGELTNPDVLVDPNVFRERMLRVRYEFSGGRVDLRLQPYLREIHYLDPAVQDQDRRGGVFEIGYRLRPRLTVSLLAARENRDYDAIGREDRDLTLNLGLANRFTRHWTGRIDLQHRERDSSAAGRSYDADAVAVSMIYRR
jgi:hypothetical protein